ncbi:gamma-glutamyltransferase [Alphaproteobacteria bacterium]|nr:gamma-glutamyltransferase [Alphaproteobacteria bacterium]
MSSGSMIVAAQPEAAEAGARVLMAGGNAIDAAITAALVQGTVDPQMCGIAGFGNCQIKMPSKGIHSCIDFHGKTPSAATAEMWEPLIESETRDGFGFVLKGNVNDLGYQSITTPGSLKAYYEALVNFGTWDWADVVAPAISHAETGFIVRPHVSFWWNYGANYGRVGVDERLKFSKTGANAYFNSNGELKKIGDRVIIPGMDATLRKIAKSGPDIFYTGEIAEQIAEDMIKNGGLLSYDDLSNYTTTRTDPLKGSYRGFEIASNHPPGGGIMLLEMLNILENFDLRKIGHNTAEYIRIVSEAMKQATIDKEMFVGDPTFVEIPVTRLLSSGHASTAAERIKSHKKVNVERVTQPETKDTTHVVVVDEDGNCVTMTHSLGMPSGVITDGLGFMYNGAMGVFDPRPGRAGSIAPGKSRFTSLAPTIVSRDDQPHIVLGAPGGTQIAMGILQAIINVIDFDMNMLEAVSAPRFSSTSNIIDVMSRIPTYVTNSLEGQDYEIMRSPLTFGIAAVHGIRIKNGQMDGGADPGHDGVALGI